MRKKLYLIITLIFPVFLSAQELTANGQAEIAIPATEATIYYSIDLTNQRADKLQQALSQKSQMIMDKLKTTKKVDKINTQAINLYPEYDQKTRALLQYRGQMSFSFTVPITEAGILLDQTIQAGANNIERIELRASPEAQRQAQFQALQQATRNGLAQAEAVLKVLNKKLGEVDEIILNPEHMPSPVFMKYEARAASLDLSGEQTIRAQVTLKIKYNSTKE